MSRVMPRILSYGAQFLPALAVLFVLLPVSVGAAERQVEHVRIDTYPERSRIIIKGNRAFTPRITPDHAQEELRIALPAMRWTLPRTEGPVGDPLVREYRYHAPSEKAAELVLGLSSAVEVLEWKTGPDAKGGFVAVIDIRIKPPSMLLPLRKPEGLSRARLRRTTAFDKLVAELTAKDKGQKDKGGAGAPKAAEQKKTISILPRPVLPPPMRPRKLKVVIDPGHGGHDPGAINGHTHEKDVVMSFANRLVGMLKASGDIDVHLTRKNNSFVSLDDRREFARIIDADLFISIHADALENPKVSGASVYVLSPKGANRTAEEFISGKAANTVISGVDLAEEHGDVAKVLVDLARRKTQGESRLFAGMLVSELEKVTPVLKKRPVRPANFRVLRAPDTPSILVELGFMTNAEDLKRFHNPHWQARTAEAMLRAIRSWSKQTQKMRIAQR